MALTATNASGTQTTTGSPQQVPASAGSLTASQQGSAVQPGTPVSALTSQNGLPLQNTPLTTINLATTSSSSVQPTPPKHHVNAALLTASILLFLVAVALFWGATRPVKNTTDS